MTEHLDLDLDDLAEVQRRVVDPVLAALFREGELTTVSLHRESSSTSQLVWLELIDVDNNREYHDFGEADSALFSARGLAQELACEIDNWISETSYAWGQRRLFHGTVPGPLTPDEQR